MTKFTDDFDIADQSGLAGTDLTWDDTVTGSGGTWKIVTNAAEIATIGASATIIARAEHDTGSPDMYVSAPVTHFGGASSYIGVAVRMNNSDGAFYDVEIGNEGSGDNIGIYRYNASGLYQATIAMATITIPGGTFILALQAEGTALRAYVDGVLAVSGTDGNITTGQRGGIAGYIRSGGSTSECRWLAFETGALTDLATIITPTQASGTGAAQSPSLTATATVVAIDGAGSGAAQSPSIFTGINISPTQAAAIGTAQAPALTATATVAPTTATGTGTAATPTVQTSGGTDIAAATATGTGTAQSPSLRLSTGIAATTKTATGTAGVPTLTGTDPTGIMRRVGGYPSPSRISPATGPRALARL